MDTTRVFQPPASTGLRLDLGQRFHNNHKTIHFNTILRESILQCIFLGSNKPNKIRPPQVFKSSVSFHVKKSISKSAVAPHPKSRWQSTSGQRPKRWLAGLRSTSGKRPNRLAENPHAIRGARSPTLVEGKSFKSGGA